MGWHPGRAAPGCPGRSHGLSDPACGPRVSRSTTTTRVPVSRSRTRRCSPHKNGTSRARRRAGQQAEVPGRRPWSETRAAQRRSPPATPGVDCRASFRCGPPSAPTRRSTTPVQRGRPLPTEARRRDIPHGRTGTGRETRKHRRSPARRTAGTLWPCPIAPMIPFTRIATVTTTRGRWPSSATEPVGRGRGRRGPKWSERPGRLAPPERCDQLRAVGAPLRLAILIQLDQASLSVDALVDAYDDH